MALAVKLEDIKIIVVPVIDVVLEADALGWVTHLGNGDGILSARRVLQGHVDEEVVCHRQALCLARNSFLHDYLVSVGGTGVGILNAEAEQRVVTHTPELLLFLKSLHGLRGQHLLYPVHLGLVTVDVGVHYLPPHKARV